jgi:hypothetical protein
MTETIDMLMRGLAGTEARGKNRKNKKKRKNNGDVDDQIFARCVNQIPACEQLVTGLCNDDAGCLNLALGCCQSLGICEFTDFIVCLNAAQK